ncbi:MAG TPA: hypothetical protein VFW39_00115 [Sphingomicrobium sp.]|nr:hypothetical protein [Sphingomicrobium sp.]
MRSAVMAAALMLVACGQKAQPSEGNVVAGTPPKVAVETAGTNSGSNVAANEAESKPSGVLPPANAAMRYVGTWAATKAECKSKPWRLTVKSLDVTGGAKCSFYNVAKAPGGYDVAAQCPTKKPVHTDLIKLRFAESAGAMLVESNAIAPTGLVYCGK